MEKFLNKNDIKFIITLLNLSKKTINGFQSGQINLKDFIELHRDIDDILIENKWSDEFVFISKMLNYCDFTNPKFLTPINNE